MSFAIAGQLARKRSLFNNTVAHSEGCKSICKQLSNSAGEGVILKGKQGTAVPGRDACLPLAQRKQSQFSSKNQTNPQVLEQEKDTTTSI